ncbi:MAG: sigma-70 family RNA polymerase sigma factor [Oscillospiraceae bacterium]|nr:sigma-70 family RNA polymerase sigma factor [Oscillospiraceae bacterium]
MILRLFQARSEDAIGQMEQKYGKLLRRIVNEILANSQDTEEVLNDTYMKLWTTIPPQKPRFLSAYAVRIARNRALKTLEYNRRLKRDERKNVLFSELEECLPGGSSPERESEAAETLSAIERWLDGLGERDRSLFLRRYFAMDSVESMARDFGMSPNAVSIRLCRMRSALKDHLEKEGVTL